MKWLLWFPFEPTLVIPVLSRDIRWHPGLRLCQPSVHLHGLCLVLSAADQPVPAAGPVTSRVWASPALGMAHPACEELPGVALQVKQLWSVFLLLLLLLPSMRCRHRFLSQVSTGFCLQDDPLGSICAALPHMLGMESSVIMPHLPWGQTQGEKRWAGVGAAGGQWGWEGAGQHRPGLTLAGCWRMPVRASSGRNWQKELDGSVRKGSCHALCSLGTPRAPKGPERALLPNSPHSRQDSCSDFTCT